MYFLQPWHMTGSEIKNESQAWLSVIWRNYIPPKFCFILWISMRGRLYTKNKWTGDLDRQCSFCKSSLETIEHLFFQCTFVRAIWAKMCIWLGIKREMATLPSVIKRIKKDYRGALIKSKAVRISFAAAVYHVWKMRNEVCFATKLLT